MSRCFERKRLPFPMLRSGGRRLLAIGFAVGLATGCGDAPAGVIDVGDLTLSVVSGDSQVGAPFEELPTPLVVRLWDSNRDRVAPGQIVNFVVVEGDGSVYAGVAQTDRNGIATDYWTLGGPGPQRLEVRAVSADGEKHVYGTFHAWAVVPFDSTPAFVQCFDDFSWTWRTGGPCTVGMGWYPTGSTVPARFRVLNADSLPLPGVLLYAEVDTLVGDSVPSNGTVLPDSALTDSLGTVWFTWQLGDSAGTNHLIGYAYRDSIRLTADYWVEGYHSTTGPDSLPPVLTSLDIVPDTVVLDSGPGWVTFRAWVTDDTAATQVVFYPVKSPWGYICPANLVAGNPQSGEWACTFAVPDSATSEGTWSLQGVMLAGVGADSAFLTKDMLDSLGFETTFEVIRATPAPDSLPPVLTAFSIVPDTVVLDSAVGWVGFDLSVADDAGATSALVRLTAPGDSALRYCWAGLVSGTAQNGLWRCWYMVTDSVAHLGNWRVEAVQLSGIGPDSLPGVPSTLTTVLTTADLVALGFPTRFLVALPSGSAGEASSRGDAWLPASRPRTVRVRGSPR